MRFKLVPALVGLALATSPAAAQGADTILNVSYDIARELFAEVNAAFVAKYQAETGRAVTIDQSHAGTSRQARAILEGLPADVVTFNQFTDVQLLHDRGNLVAADWQARLPNNASPFYSLPAFLVRAGNPKDIQDWSDLAREDVAVVFPNPKTSGNARYTYLAAWVYGLEAFDGNEAQVRDFVGRIFQNVPVFDTGGRAATLTFAEREIGDVLVTFEAEVLSIREEFGEAGFEAVVPSVSLLAEFPVAVVDAVVDRRGSRELAEAYLDFLYTPEGQAIAAGRNHRVHDPEVRAEFAHRFPEVRLVTVEEVFGGWEAVSAEHFASDGILDQVFVNQ
ncbi:MAG: sulfate ABC transporter substrate-binding protein [Geminicoccaceae bacterium]|nr:MAG: sulfate ABC transporter substrate-binding protein [Geminicoccaceae bacterium]